MIFSMDLHRKSRFVKVDSITYLLTHNILRIFFFKSNEYSQSKRAKVHTAIISMNLLIVSRDSDEQSITLINSKLNILTFTLNTFSS